MVRKGKLSCGFEFEIDDTILDDMTLLDDLVEVDSGNIMKFPGLLIKLLGKEQKDALYEALRDAETGRVPVEPMTDALIEMIEQAGAEGDAGKN